MPAPEPDDQPTVARRSTPATDPDTVTAAGSTPAPFVPEATTVTPAGADESGPDDQTRVRPPAVAGRLDPAGAPLLHGYELGREIARGGMGVVCATRYVELDREVAIKVMLPGMNATEFVRESRITARLPHPGIPPVHSLGTLPDGRPFLAMKLIRGETLDALLRVRTDPAERGRFVAAFEQMCQAVGYAHARGIVHRDPKPSNVMVGSFGEVQVMDWGLAKAFGESHAGAPPRTRTACRRRVWRRSRGLMKGTPSYLAPVRAGHAG